MVLNSIEIVLRPYSLTYLLAVISHLVLIVLLIRKEYKVQVTTWFLVFTTMLLSWSTLSFIESLLVLPEHYSAIERYKLLFFYYVPITFLFFSLSYTGMGKLVQNHFVLLSILIPFLLFQYLEVSTELLTKFGSIALYLPGIGYFFEQGPLFVLHVVWVVLLFVLSFVFLVNFYVASSQIEKRDQSGLLIWSLIVPLIGGAFSDGILPIFKIYIPSLAVPLTSITSILISFAVVKHGLFSLDTSMIVENITETMPEAFLVLDKEYVIRLTNKTTTELTGYEAKDLIGMHVNTLFSSHDDLDVFKSFLQKTLEEHHIVSSENKIKKNDGKLVPVSMYTSAQLDENNKNAVYIVMFHSIQAILEKNEALNSSLQEIKKQNLKLEQLNKLMIGRELKMINLKQEVEFLRAKSKQAGS